MPESAAPLPVTVVSGYLGAGKTTLVNHLLRHPEGRRLMVLVNDFGDLAIDADLIEAESGDMLTLANGCVCCSMGGDFYNALVTVLEMERRPDHLVIEASGVARPARIANIARAESDLLLDCVVTLVDAENFTGQMDDRRLTDSLTDQVAAADLLLLNKADLASQDQLAALKGQLRAINEWAPVMTCVSAAVPLDLVLGGQAAARDEDSPSSQAHGHEEDYRRWSHECSGPFDRERLKQALADFPDAVLRIKGVIYLSDQADPVAVHRVGKRVTLVDLPSVAASAGLSRFVAIGHRSGFDPAPLAGLIESARS